MGHFTSMKKTVRKFVEKRVASTDLKVGDVFWFSGYWCALTRFVGNKVYARFPYTPEGKDVHMFCHHGALQITVRVPNPDVVAAD